MPNLVMLAAHPTTIDVTGPAVRAAGWYGPTDGLHTLMLQTRNLRGTFRLEGALAPKPTEADWFPIPLLSPQPTAMPSPTPAPLILQDQISFPRSVQMSSLYGPGWTGETASLGFNFVCNCLFLRARLIRSDIIAPQANDMEISQYGAIDLVMVKY